jgi:uncharacterized protein (UPF0332 family)
VNRAYYAAFYAVSALLALDDLYFKKHSAVESAVHKHLINTGKWEESLGSDYAKLYQLREIADYGGLSHITKDEALEATERARRLVKSVSTEKPDMFPLSENRNN